MSDDRILEERADAYLDGDLGREEALAFERDLAVRPEVADALAAALALRELLGSLPPLAPPAGLTDRIARALPLGRRASPPTPAGDRSPVRAALAGLAWTFRGTTVAAMGAAAPALSASTGMAQVRWALGPLGATSEPAPRPPRPLWRRLLFRRGAP
jgi:anti-sigma factor RsiW